MAKRIFAAIRACMLLVAALQVHAATRESIATGCDLLAQSVQQAVLQAVSIDHTDDPQRGEDSIRRAGESAEIAEAIRTCGNTSQVTTAAFGAAFAQIGLPVVWNRNPIDYNDYCVSQHLSQCNPRLTTGYVAAGGTYPRLVNDSWTAVSRSVSSFRPFGTPGNLTRFAMDALHLSLQASIANYVHVPPR